MSSPALSLPHRSWLEAPDRKECDWPGAVVDDCLVAHLNLRGPGEVEWQDGTTLSLPPRSICWLRGRTSELRAARRLASRDRHECLTLLFPLVWLHKTLVGIRTGLNPDFQPLVQTNERTVLQHPMHDADEGWARGAMPPQLCVQARQLLDTARLTEYLVRALFRPGDTDSADAAISRTERTSQERVRRVKEVLLARMESPPSLNELAVVAGCAASHLSRTFTQVEGLTLSNWLRRARIERAASLIASGRCNVSEAALEVGYQSFSHFSRAFAEEMGALPSQWVKRLVKSG